MKIKKMFCSVDHIWDMKWTEFKAKILIQDRIELIKFLCIIKIIKKYTLKEAHSKLSHFHKSVS